MGDVVRRWGIGIGCALLGLLFLAGSARAEEEGEREGHHEKKAHAKAERHEREGLSAEGRAMILEWLEHGIHALRELGHKELAGRLLAIAREVQADAPKHGKGAQERAVAKRQIRVIKLGVPVLVEAGREDAADLLERAAHAREMRLARRKDAEAREIREAAPREGQLIELLLFAAQQAKAQGKRDVAEALHELGQAMRKRWRKRQAREKGRGGAARKKAGKERRARRREAARAEREKRKARLRPVPDGERGLLRAALDMLLEHDDHERGHRVELASAWRRLRAEGKGEDASAVRRRAPGPAELARHLRRAADQWAEVGHERMAKALDDFARRLERASRTRRRAR